MDWTEVDPGAVGMDATRLARIDGRLRSEYLDQGRLAGYALAVVRRGVVAHASCYGYADIERRRPMSMDTMWRAYSMTKPVTGVALMTLYEQGRFDLDDPVARFIPSWRDVRVADGEGAVEPRRPPRVKDLLMHTSGLGYGPGNASLDFTDVRQAKHVSPSSHFPTLESMADSLGAELLRFHPGERWLYSFGVDVCARLVEVLSARRFEEYIRSEVLVPLGMLDTDFFVPDEKVERFAACYASGEDGALVVMDDPTTSSFRVAPEFCSGGGGLVTTLADYAAFLQMLANGGDLNGARVLSRQTVELMTTNLLPRGADVASLAVPGGYGAEGFEGWGFGLTMAVALGPAATSVVGSPGEFTWDGAASTTFWVDPKEDLVVVFATQLMPTRTYDIPRELRALVYQAIAT